MNFVYVCIGKNGAVLDGPKSASGNAPLSMKVSGTDCRLVRIQEMKLNSSWWSHVFIYREEYGCCPS